MPQVYEYEPTEERLHIEACMNSAQNWLDMAYRGLEAEGAPAREDVPRVRNLTQGISARLDVITQRWSLSDRAAPA